MIDLLNHERAAPEAVALLDAETGDSWTYSLLQDEVDSVAGSLAGEKAMVLLLLRRDIPSLIAYLGALRAGHAVLPIDADLNASLIDGLVRRYRPEWILGDHPTLGSVAPLHVAPEASGRLGSGRILYRRYADQSATQVHPSVCLLLSTSGSTGSPKLVRLSAANVIANGDGIRRALHIDVPERAITTLPFSYSFGLSVVHSHLLAGATLVVTGRSVMTTEFWQQLRKYEATSFSGVPYTYEILRRVGFQTMDLPRLRTLTQAGGKLGSDLIRFYFEHMARRGGGFVTMYGQTEATARIAILPPQHLPAKLGGVGFPLPGGHLTIQRPDGGGTVASGGTGEVVYEGPNVMLGYAESRSDLARGDELKGLLHTGDTGYLDTDGCLFITGRLKRFAKLQGRRVSLDEVEGQLHGAGSVAALDDGDRIVICCTAGSERDVRAAVTTLTRQMRLNARSISVCVVDNFPLLPNGKIDYRSLGSRITL